MTDYVEKKVEGTPYIYDMRLQELISSLNQRVFQLRRTGRLTPETLQHIRKFFRIKNIHNSNAIEGNLLDYGETRMVVEEGLTITGKPLKDSLEARNLAHAMDFFEELATKIDQPLRIMEIRQIHQSILRDIDDDNAGKYRQVEVEISGSKFRPPSHISVSSEMEKFGLWLENAISNKGEPSDNPIVLAATSHAWFVYIHPFIDGNGRTARILMNLVLMRYGYPIAVITKDDRHRYYDALEESQSSDLTPFISLLCDAISESLDEYEKALLAQRERDEWAASLITRVERDYHNKARQEFEVWRSAMDLMKGYFKQTVGLLNEQSQEVSLVFREYDVLDFEKYVSLNQGQTAKRTWFFKVNFSLGPTRAWYLFFFGFATPYMEGFVSNNVSVLIAREDGHFHYKRLDEIFDLQVPDLREIAYSQKDEGFYCRHTTDKPQKQKVEVFARNFITQVMDIHFLQKQ